MPYESTKHLTGATESLMWFYRDAEVARLRTCAEISLDFGRFQRAIVDREEMELP